MHGVQLINNNAGLFRFSGEVEREGEASEQTGRREPVSGELCLHHSGRSCCALERDQGCAAHSGSIHPQPQPHSLVHPAG